jgi:hydroxymethylbilane synthase
MPQSSSRTVLRIGTRGSRLALTQAEFVKDALNDRDGIKAELVVIRTSGDRILDRPLADIGGKGLFAKELEEALLARDIDLAVHSMKDMPAQLPSGLRIVATPARENPADAVICGNAGGLECLPPGARIGTSSVRRKAQIARARPDLEIVALRGNVDTRLAKLDAADVDALVLAYAGLTRLGLQQRASAILSTDTWLPAPAQGAVGIEMREDHGCANFIASVFDDATTAIELSCERAFLAALDGSCRTPIAGLATLAGDCLLFRGELLAPDGAKSAAIRIDVRLGDRRRAEAARLGEEAGLDVKRRAQAWLAP